MKLLLLTPFVAGVCLWSGCASRGSSSCAVGTQHTFSLSMERPMAEESYSSLRLQAVRADGAASFYLPGKNIVIQLRPGQTYKDDYPAVTLVSSDHRRGETLITEQL